MSEGRIYIPYQTQGAGLWIYKGYAAAWKNKGFGVQYYTAPTGVKYIVDDPDTPSRYLVMATEGSFDYSDPYTYKFLSNAERVFLFVQPTKFPEPWGTHPNYVSKATDEFISKVNEMDNIVLWAFSDTSNVDFWDKWKTVHYVPLAFDDLNYGDVPRIHKELSPKKEYKVYDVAYIGGVADNGFNEKMVIMTEYFTELGNRGIKTDGIFVNHKLPHEKEFEILSSCKICLNLHDKYQQKLGLDCNERTFKSLGLNGFLISDKVDVLDNILPQVIPQAESPKDMADLVEEYLAKDLSGLKRKNKAEIMSNHTYSSRVAQLLKICP